MIVLRILAVLVAIGGILDPAFRVSRTEPLPVRLFTAADDPDAAAIASRLRTALADRADLVDAGSGAATVVIGRAAITPPVMGGGPVSTVTLEEPPFVAIEEVPSGVSLIPGSMVDIPVTLRAVGLTGQRSVLVLEQDGVELSRTEHVWTADGGVTVSLPYFAASPGARRLTVRVQPSAGERRVIDNEADLLAMVASRPGRVAVIETRPSWSAGFIRRALEADPAFQVSSVVRTSRGIASRAGDAPPVIQASQLSRFDVVIAGAPEDLRREEVDALWQFADRRAGTVVLFPDRMPGGPYAERLPGRFAEHLLNEPRALDPAGVLASELLTMTTMPRGARAIATLNGAAVIAAWPVGDGRVIFSGALDAWRYRADPKSRLAPFWRQELLTAVLGAPPPIRIDLRPAIVRPGGTASLRVRLRRTEWMDPDSAKPEAALPPISARISDASGKVETIRLWPEPEAGGFRGEVIAATAGIHTVRVETDQHASEATLLSDSGAAPPVNRSVDLSHVAALTGGVTVNASETDKVVQHLSSLSRPSRSTLIRPFQSAWWPWVFATLLTSEWAFRRRAGQR
jgi:hypothetical protein